MRILGSMQIFKSISINCVICLKDRKKYLRMLMGGLADSQLAVSPLFYFTMVDMWGPLKAYCPGYERTTRRDKAYEVYFLVFCCVATGAVNVQLIEGKKTEFVLDGCSRFFSETSVPKIMYPDDDGALQKAFREGEIEIEDLSGRLFKSNGIYFETCPPQAHSSHGKVERVIRSLQDSFSRSGASSSRCTATGWHTMGKAMEREVNNTPIGFLYEKSAVDGNPLLRVLRPSSLKGMNASDRAPRGLFSIPDLPSQHFSKVEEAFNLWTKCWATSYVPIILERQKWTQADPNLSVNDVIYFKLDESPMKADWKIGKVDSVKFGRDGKVREVNVAYKIIKEGLANWTHSVVTRPVREIIKLFEVNDTTFADEMRAAHKAATKILRQRGALEEASQIDDWPGVDATAVNDTVVKDDSKNDDEISTGNQENLEEQPNYEDTTAMKCDVSKNHQPFISCLSTDEWLQQGAADVSGEAVQGDDGDDDQPDCGAEELLFLL